MMRCKFYLGLLPALLYAATLHAAPQSIHAILVTGNQLISTDTIKKVSGLQVGQPYQPELLSRATSYLKQWGIFDAVTADTQSTPQGVDITFSVREATLLADIHISGNYPYIEDKILKRLSAHSGDPYSENLALEQETKISDFYQREGFYQTKISHQTTPAKEKGDVLLDFKIKRGKFLRLKSLSVTGNHRWPKGRFVSLLNPLQPFSEKRLQASIQKIEQLYLAQGFFKAHVQVVRKDVDIEKGSVQLALEISEGPQVKVHFLGNTIFGPERLKKQITLYEESSFDEFELEASRKKLGDFYREKAYPNALITTTKQQIKPDRWAVFFHIDSGPYESVKKVRFFDNRLVASSTLRKVMLTRKHSLSERGPLLQELLKEDKKLIEEFYHHQGFLQAQVMSIQPHKTPSGFSWFVDVTVDEGEKTTVADIQFMGDTKFSRKDLLKTLAIKIGKPFNPLLLESDSDALIFYYKDRGYPYVAVEQTVEEITTHQKTVHYKITPGPIVRIGSIVVVGDILTTVGAVKKAMTLHEGDLYSYEKILTSELSLRRLGTFRSVRIDTLGLAEQDSNIHLVVHVEERQPFVVDLDTQYSTDKQYSGSIRFTNYNSFGLAKQTNVLFRAGLENARTETNWIDPRFLGNDLQFSMGGWLDYSKLPAQSSIQPGGSFGFFRQFHKIGLLSRYELSRSYILDNTLTSTNERDSTLSKVILSGSFDTRDNFGDPRRGIFTLIGTTLENEIQGAQANFVKIRGGFNHYWTLWNWFTLSQTMRIDRIESIGNHVNVPTTELLFLGGDDTVRGFSEDRVGTLDANRNPLGGRTRLIYNAELHFRLTSSLQLATFFDAGSLTNTFKQINTETIRDSAGLGLRYITPVGPIRADYGIVLDRKSGESFGRFHLTFGYPF